MACKQTTSFDMVQCSVEKRISEDSPLIEKLNDDCLRHIFGYLPIINRLRAETVCKRWKNLMWSNMGHLDFFESTWIESKKLLQKMTINDETFKNLMQRFGKCLRSLDLYCEFSPIQHELTPESIQLICQMCPNLQTLYLGQMCQIFKNCSSKSVEADDCECEEGLSKIMQSLKNSNLICKLKKFGLEVLHCKADSISGLISKMSSLESLYMNFETYYYIEGSYFSGLPFTSLREIIFENCESLPEKHIISVIKKIPAPHTLVLIDLLSYDVLRQLLPSQIETLKNLALHSYSYSAAAKEQAVGLPIQASTELTPLLQFVNLERLNLRDNTLLVSDEFLIKLTENCKQLMSLDVSNSDVTDSGIQHVATLPKLEYLFIRKLGKVTGKTLKPMHNLKLIDCYGCSNLEDEGVCAVVRQSSNLRALILAKCEKITNQFLNTAIEVTSMRDNRLDLTLSIWDTQIDVGKVERLPHLLRVEVILFPRHGFNHISQYFPKIGPSGVYTYITELDTFATDQLWMRSQDGILSTAPKLPEL